MTAKKTTPSSHPAPATAPFVSATWDNLWGLADDTRAELHKQIGALIAFADGALHGVTGYATKLNDRWDEIAREGLIAANQSGRALVGTGRDASSKLVAASRDRTSQLVTSTRDNARSVADRATATARVLIAPVKQDKAA